MSEFGEHLAEGVVQYAKRKAESPGHSLGYTTDAKL
jgi:hypothetical protein